MGFFTWLHNKQNHEDILFQISCTQFHKPLKNSISSLTNVCIPLDQHLVTWGHIMPWAARHHLLKQSPICNYNTPTSSFLPYPRSAFIQLFHTCCRLALAQFALGRPWRNNVASQPRGFTRLWQTERFGNSKARA